MDDGPYGWAKPFPELYKVCLRFGLTEIADPKRFAFNPAVKGIMQEGPRCGLVALAMCTQHPDRGTVEELYKQAVEMKFSYNGEIFNADDMFQLARKNLKTRITLFEGLLNAQRTKTFLLSDGLILVPYDCDKDHRPCRLKGLKAHWALIVGCVETEGSFYVLARHGKSRNLAVWSLASLSESNSQLQEFLTYGHKSSMRFKLCGNGCDISKGLGSRSVWIWPPVGSDRM